MNEMMIFNNPEFGEMRTIEKDGQPWFVAADVCKALKLGDTGKAAGRLEDDELTRIKIGSGAQNREMIIINEPGLYYLIRRQGTDYNMPTQRSMELELFEIKEPEVTHLDGHTTVNKTPKVTGKGQQYIVNAFLGQ